MKFQKHEKRLLHEWVSSGVPTIQEELEKNGSPRAEFFTDEDRRAMRIRIPIHPVFLENDDKSNEKMLESVSNETSFETSLKQDEYKKLKPIIEKLGQDKAITIQEAMKLTGKSRSTAWRYMQLLVDYDVVKPFGNTNTSIYEVIDDEN